jgi:hypothetical protein
MTKSRTNLIFVAGVVWCAAVLLWQRPAAADPDDPSVAPDVSAAAPDVPEVAPDVYEPPPRHAPKLPAQIDHPVFSWTPLPFTVAGELRTTWLQDSAARRLVGKGAPTALGLSLGYDAISLSPKATGGVDLGWAKVSTDNAQPYSNENNTESFKTNLLTLGLSVRYEIFRWLAPYARLAGGIGWDKLTVGNDAGSLSDEHKFGHASAGGGIFLRSPGLCLSPSPASYCGALTGHIEGGYMIATSSTFSLHSSPASGISRPIPTEPVPIGKLGRNAPYLRISLGVSL